VKKKGQRILVHYPPKAGPRLLILIFPEIVDNVVRAVSEGQPLKLACRQGKISEQTLHNYLNAGEAVAEERDKALTEGQPFAISESQQAVLQFFERVREAQAISNRREVGLISVAAKKDWKAAAFLLQNKHPQAFPVRSGGGSASVTTTNQEGVSQVVEFSWADGTPDNEGP
jgi:hypothetical protein